MLNAFFKKENKKEGLLLCSSNACQHNLVSTRDHLQAILGKELKFKNHIWSCKCAPRVCVKEDRMAKEEIFKQAQSNSVKWDFKNKPRQPGAMCSQAGKC